MKYKKMKKETIRSYFEMTDQEVQQATEYDLSFKSDSIEIKEDEKGKKCFLYFKNNLVESRFIIYDGPNFDEILLQANDFLNIDSIQFPGRIKFTLLRPIQPKFSSRVILDLEKINNILFVKFTFFIREEEDFLTMNINPVKHLFSFLDLAKKEGYQTETAVKYSPENLWGSILINFPAEGNLFESYQKHFLKIKELYEKAALDMGFKGISMLRENGDD